MSKSLILVLLMALTATGLRFWMSSNSQYLNEWDERFHALVAKNMATDNEFFKPKLYANPVLPYSAEEWTKNHVWLHKQPLTIWIMAVSIKAFGATVTAIRLPSILFLLFGAFLIYRIGLSIFDPATAVVASGLFSFGGLGNLLSTGKVPTDHVDVYFMFLLLLAAFFIYCRKASKQITLNDFLIGAAIGSAVLVKWLPAYTMLIVYMIKLWELRDYRRISLKLIVVVLTSIFIWLPWQVYTSIEFPSEFQATHAHNFDHIFSSLGKHENGYFYFFSKTHYLYGEIGVLAILLFMFKTLRSTNINLLSLLAWLLLPLAFFSMVSTKMQAYTYFTAPAIYLLSGALIQEVKGIVKNKKIAILIIIALLISPAIRLFESCQFRKIDDYAALKYETLLEESNTIVFGSDRPFNDMFFNTIVASYKTIPEQHLIDSLKEQYVVVIRE